MRDKVKDINIMNEIEHGKEIDVDARFRIDKTETEFEYAGFWRRLTAFLIDYVLIMVVVMILMSVFDDLLSHQAKNQMLWQLNGVIVPLFMVSFWLYFALWESSKKQATIGKILLGLKVMDDHGQRLSFLRATGRHFAKLISILILMIGVLMIAFTKQKQGLHDVFAKALVIHYIYP